MIFSSLPPLSMPIWLPILFLVVEWCVRIALSVRVLLTRKNISEALAWIGVLLIFPIGGILLYLWFGERRVGNRGAGWAEKISGPIHNWLVDTQPRMVHNWAPEHYQEQALARLVNRTVGMPAICHNRLTLLNTTESLDQTLIADVTSARTACYLEFYIWTEGGFTDRLVEALIAASERGVDCRILVDDLGSRRFLRTKSAARMRSKGVRIESAFKIGLIRSWHHRVDLRLHRKIIVIDDRIAYTGSQNMVDPASFKQTAGVGQWVDAMARIEGEAAEALLAVFLSDWQAETGEGAEILHRATQSAPDIDDDGAIVHVIPSGPLIPLDVSKQIIITALYAAKRQLVLTTPYYVPDASVQMALIAAAHRGVDVTLIVPQKNDSRLVALASAPSQDELVAAGVRVLLYSGGLLHTKSVTVDDRISLFGSLNLDLRSLHLNFEITLAVYDRAFTVQLRRLQQSYMQQSADRKTLIHRPKLARRLVENAARLLAPLL